MIKSIVDGVEHFQLTEEEEININKNSIDAIADLELKIEEYKGLVEQYKGVSSNYIVQFTNIQNEHAEMTTKFNELMARNEELLNTIKDNSHISASVTIE